MSRFAGTHTKILSPSELSLLHSARPRASSRRGIPEEATKFTTGPVALSTWDGACLKPNTKAGKTGAETAEITEKILSSKPQ